MNAVALALWFFVVLAVIWQVPDKTNFLIGCALGVPIIACSLFFSRKWGIIRADRAVAVLVVPWVAIIIGAWLLRTVLYPGMAWICDSLFKNFEFPPFEANKINQGAWIVAAFGYISAIHSILTDRSMKKQ
jgi:MFS superfamily sulfate permease-like transporter